MELYSFLEAIAGLFTGVALTRLYYQPRIREQQQRLQAQEQLEGILKALDRAVEVCPDAIEEVEAFSRDLLEWYAARKVKPDLPAPRMPKTIKGKLKSMQVRPPLSLDDQ